MQLIYTNKLLERVAINFIKLLLKTDFGNRQNLTVVDNFTKHVRAYAVTDQNVSTVARVFFKYLVSWYKVPYVIHRNQSANFKSNLFKQLCQMININKTRTTLYYLQCDEQVKRMNCTIIDLLKFSVCDAISNWDQNIKLAAMVYRSTVQVLTCNYLACTNQKCVNCLT